MQPAQQPSFATTAIIYAVVIALLVWRLARPQRMPVWRLWLMPVILLGLTLFSIWANNYASVVEGQAPPPAWELAAVVAAGAALGIPLGFLRGRHSEVKAADRPGVMYVHSSPFIVVVWLAAFVARAAVRAYLRHAGGTAALVSDALLAFAVGALITSYYAIYQKYRALVQHAPTT